MWPQLPERWYGKRIRVDRPQPVEDGLLIPPTVGTLINTNDPGILLIERATKQQVFIPWHLVGEVSCDE